MPRMRGEVDVGGMALTGEELGAVEAAGFDSNENLVIGGCRDGHVSSFKTSGSPGVWMTAAFMMAMMLALVEVRTKVKV